MVMTPKGGPKPRDVAGPIDSSYHTKLSKPEEREFHDWFRALGDAIGRPPGSPDDPTYDYRGFWRSQKLGGRGTGLDPGTGTIHFPDTFKTPVHPTFSNESKYAPAGFDRHWKGNVLVDKTGRATQGSVNEALRDSAAKAAPKKR
jgi:hypothetical protein